MRAGKICSRCLKRHWTRRRGTGSRWLQAATRLSRRPRPICANFRWKVAAARTPIASKSGSRPDTNRVKIHTRIPLRGTDPGVTMAADRIKALVKGIPASGRFFIETGTTSLAIDKPEQYCRDVVHHITKEATAYAKMSGADYGVRSDGLDGELYFQQSSETEVFLYIELPSRLSPNRG